MSASEWPTTTCRFATGTRRTGQMSGDDKRRSADLNSVWARKNCRRAAAASRSRNASRAAVRAVRPSRAARRPLGPAYTAAKIAARTRKTATARTAMRARLKNLRVLLETRRPAETLRRPRIVGGAAGGGIRSGGTPDVSRPKSQRLQRRLRSQTARRTRAVAVRGRTPWCRYTERPAPAAPAADPHAS